MTSTDDPRAITSLWWLPVLFGVVAIGVGVVFIVAPHDTLKTFTVIGGIFLLIDGILAIAGSIFGRGEGRAVLALIGVLSAIAGLILIKKPFDTLVVFTLIIGIWFVVGGIARVVSAFSDREGRGTTILVGLVDGVIGIVLLAWPDLGLATFAVIVGIGLLIRGALFVAAGLMVRRADQSLAAS